MTNDILCFLADIRHRSDALNGEFTLGRLTLNKNSVIYSHRHLPDVIINCGIAHFIDFSRIGLYTDIYQNEYLFLIQPLIILALHCIFIKINKITVDH